MLGKEEARKEKESLGENPRSVMALKSREENVLRRKCLLTVSNDAEILSKIRWNNVHWIWQHGNH